MEEKELSSTAGENAKWYNHVGRQFDSYLQTAKHILYHAV